MKTCHKFHRVAFDAGCLHRTTQAPLFGRHMDAGKFLNPATIHSSQKSGPIGIDRPWQKNAFDAPTFDITQNSSLKKTTCDLATFVPSNPNSKSCVISTREFATKMQMAALQGATKRKIERQNQNQAIMERQQVKNSQKTTA